MQIAPIVLYTMAKADGATGVHLLGLGSHDAYKELAVFKLQVNMIKLTLNISDALLQDLLQNLGVLELLLDLANDGIGKLLLLALLNLALVADPRVQDLLGLGGQSSALLKLVGLGLELGSLLYAWVRTVLSEGPQCLRCLQCDAYGKIRLFFYAHHPDKLERKAKIIE